MATGIGLRAVKGGAVAVVVRVDGGVPSLVVSTFLPTHDPAEPLSLEPYGAAYAAVQAGGTREAAAVLVERGRTTQERLAEGGLRRSIAGLTGPITAGLLINRAGWITDLLEHSLGWAEHAPVCDGLAVREALRAGLAACGVATVEIDEKTVDTQATEKFGTEVDSHIKAMGALAGKPWRKEQKLACLAAWIAAVG